MYAKRVAQRRMRSIARRGGRLSPFPGVQSIRNRRLAGSAKAVPARSDAGLAMEAPGFPVITPPGRREVAKR